MNASSKEATALDGAELSAKSLNYTASRKLFCVKRREKKAKAKKADQEAAAKAASEDKESSTASSAAKTDRTVRHKQHVEGRFVAHHGAMPGATAAHLTIRARGEEAATATMWNVRHCPE